MSKWPLKAIYLLFFTATSFCPMVADQAINIPQAHEISAENAITTDPQGEATPDTLKKEELPFSPETWEEEAKKEIPPQTNLTEAFVKMILLLGLTLGLLVAVAWGSKRFLRGKLLQTNRSSRIQIIEQRALSPKSFLYVIEIDNQQLIIGESPAGLHMIKDLSAAGHSTPL